MRRSTTIPSLLALWLLLTGCASPGGAPAPPPTEGGDDHAHGDVKGAEQVAEPQSQLIAIDADGEVSLLDLLTDETTRLGAIGSPEAIASDGRYAFVTTANGLEVVDGGRWTWDHGDHFHYYRAAPSITGVLDGEGPVIVTGAPLATAGGTGVFFSGSGEAVVLDNEALSTGEIEERLRIDTGSSRGVVAPVGDGALVATEAGQEAVVYDASGERTGAAPCAAPSDAITTRVGTVVGCEDGALLAVAEGDEVSIERIPYPDDTAERASALDGRKNRPTVSGLSGDSGFWLLDTRDRSWSHASVERTLVEAVAADDEDGHVVALDADGRVVVYDEGGEELAVGEPLVGDSLADGAVVDLTVDQQRAYLSDPSAGAVYEIDYADGARVARELTPPTTPVVATELGR